MEAPSHDEALDHPIARAWRWPEIAARFSNPAERGAIREFLLRARERVGDTGSAGLAGALLNWASGEMMSPYFKQLVSTTVIAAAVQEYHPNSREQGNYSGRHVWSYVTIVAQRFEREAAGSGSSVSLLATKQLQHGRQASAVWRLVKREGLVSCQPEIARQRVARLVDENVIADAAAFLRFLMALPRGELERAKTDHYAEKFIAEALSKCPVSITEAA